MGARPRFKGSNGAWTPTVGGAHVMVGGVWRAVRAAIVPVGTNWYRSWSWLPPTEQPSNLGISQNPGTPEGVAVWTNTSLFWDIRVRWYRGQSGSKVLLIEHPIPASPVSMAGGSVGITRDSYYGYRHGEWMSFDVAYYNEAGYGPVVESGYVQNYNPNNQL